MLDPVTLAFLAIVAFALVLYMRNRQRRGPAKRRPSVPSAPPATVPVHAVAPPAAPPRQPTQREREAEAQRKGWALYGSGAQDAVEETHSAGSADFQAAVNHARLTPEDVARAAQVRIWHPYWKDGLSSFIYHYTDLLDRDGNLIAQSLDAEDIRD